MADPTPLVSYLRVQRATDREILRLLQRSYSRASAELTRLSGRTGIGVAVRREQIAASLAAVQREIASMYRALGLQLQAARAEAAAAAVESMYPMTNIRRVIGTDRADELLRAAQAQAASSAELLVTRYEMSRIPLSEQVYRTRELTAGLVDDAVDAALAAGSSARELAASVRGLIRPDTPGGVRYAALRLGRTELNNAFHASQKASAVQTPWCTGVKWHLSGSHPVPDQCNTYAESVHIKGEEAGVFRPEDLPAKPHPNCLCYTTSVTVSDDQFFDAFLSGDYDEFIDSVIAAGGIVIR